MIQKSTKKSHKENKTFKDAVLMYQGFSTEFAQAGVEKQSVLHKYREKYELSHCEQKNKNI